MIRAVYGLFAVVSALCLQAATEEDLERVNRLFGIDSRSNIISPDDCGLVNGHVTFNGWFRDVTQIKGFFAPPFASSNFSFVMLFNGMPVGTTDYRWHPQILTRNGRCREWRISSRLIAVAGERAALMEVEVENIGGVAANLNVKCVVFGNSEKLNAWQFGKPEPSRHVPCRVENGVAILEDAVRSVQLAVTLPEGRMEVDFDSKPRGWKHRFYVAIAIGEIDDAVAVAKRANQDPEVTFANAACEWKVRVAKLFSRLPVLKTDSIELERLYTRSLLHLLLNEWNVREFVLHPYYSTGGINGGCVGNYLWNFGEVYRLWPLLDPVAAKAHLKKFLSLDLEKCFAFDPCSGKSFGPYYPVNQEKVLLLSLAYVEETGDVGFLRELVDKETVLAKLTAAALAHDDLSRSAVLVDYGNGNHHLELRKRWRYDGVLPDMNLRRVVCYHLADRLYRLAGATPPVDFLQRAHDLKTLVCRELYDARVGWYRVVQPNGERELRWTLQMFKALGWGDWVLGKEEETALIGHLMDNRKFLGSRGLHSLAKIDPGYDENDVDNGGPGACVSFAPAVVDRLYRSGYVKEAESIFRRLWWLGGCLPYWGDSHYADRMDYRRDTPLMNDIQGAALAQTVIFGLFGVQISEDFKVSFNPHLPSGVQWIRLEGFKVLGRNYTVSVSADEGVSVDELGNE